MATLNYAGRVPKDVAYITVTPTTEDATETIKVNNRSVNSGTASKPILLTVGINTIEAVLTEVTIDGTSLYSLAEAAEQFGFRAEAYELTYENLSKIKLPCIAHYGGTHFIVIYS